MERLVGVGTGTVPLGRPGGRKDAVPTSTAGGSGAGGGVAGRAASRNARNGAGGGISSVLVGVYGLDLIRPSAIVGNLRIGTTAVGRE